MWICPHCRNPLQPDAERSLACSSGHRFDIAREGYVNLLPANRKRSKEPGDSGEMIAARDRIHRTGLYQPLAAAIVEQAVATGQAPGEILDLGCGEGYYSLAMMDAFPGAERYGIDIAKSAVRLAARRDKTGHFAVASAVDVPLSRGSVGLVLSVFAPADDAELLRVLRPGGLYLKVVPAPRHLWALRCLLYDQPRAHAEELHCPSGLEIVNREALDYPLELDSELLHDLVAMTPYAHKGQREHRGRLEELNRLQVQMSFTIAVMRAA